MHIRFKGTLEPWRVIEMDGPTITIDGLQAYSEYELYAVRVGDEAAHSALRFVLTGYTPTSW